ncbi:MAG: metal-dependent hydrolase [Candidatus Aenigmarchaeota archaeon]|nr:metal-dependent hydrolase [Candidatus Aenigmarchaeota archaeon]
MERRTHIIFGIFLFVLLWAAFKLDIALSALVAVGSVFPDLDYRKGLTVYHRKLAHNIWVMLLASIIIALVANSIEFGMAFALGFMSHVLIDALTPMGVYPLYPLKSSHPYFLVGGKAKITTGSRGEKVFQALIVIATVFVLLLVGGIL